MAYYTGRDVDVYWVTEHDSAGIHEHTDLTLRTLESYDASADEIVRNRAQMGNPSTKLSDVTGVDVSIGAQDEDVSYMGLRNIGKIEVKKDTSITVTMKKKDRHFLQLFQGSTDASFSNGSGGHPARHGIEEITSGDINIQDGTIDPKSTLDSNSTISYGYRVAIQLKADSTGTADDGTVIVLRNCSLGDYTHTLSNDAANEESVTFVSMVSPLITSGRKTGNVFDGCETATAAADM